jgi:hypothetical protein
MIFSELEICQKINDPILRIFLSPLSLEATALVQGRLVSTRLCEDYVETFFHDHEFLIFSPLGRIARRFGSRVVGGRSRRGEGDVEYQVD